MSVWAHACHAHADASCVEEVGDGRRRWYDMSVQELVSHVTSHWYQVAAGVCSRGLTRECLQVSRRGARGRIQRRHRRAQEQARDGRVGRGIPDTRATGLPPAFIRCGRHGRRQSSVESRGARAPPRSGALPSPSLSLSLALCIYGGARSGGAGWR
jgi:hypothetical protein